MLELESIHTGYNRVPVLSDLSFAIAPGESLAIGGPNGAGKSTLLKLLAGLLPIWRGRLLYDGVDISTEATEARVARGIVLCPEGRRIFSSLSVEENLRIGATALRRGPHRKNGRSVAEGLDRAYQIFPLLKERRAHSGGTLSGGQQQMLAVARALMAEPRILLLDEPSLGLSPRMADEIYETLSALRGAGLAMIIVEEAAGRPLAIADRGILMRRGRIVRSGQASELRQNADFTADYLGHAA